MYGDLDSVVEAVLTEQNANPSALLAAANSVGQQLNSADRKTPGLIGPG